MDQILDHFVGMIEITNYVIVHDKDDEEHDGCLHKLMEVSSGKCAVKQPSITFFGCVYDKQGEHADPAKVSAVHNMPPETLTQTQMFPGMVTYLSLFMPSLPSFTSLLCELLKKGTEFTLNQSYQEAFDTMKCPACTDTSLRYSVCISPSQSR